MRNLVHTLAPFVLALTLAACSDRAQPPSPAADGGAGSSGTGGAGGTGGASGTGGACVDEVKACDPFYETAQTGCAAARQTCHATNDGTTICACQSDTPGPQNAPCFSGPGDCQQGFVCVNDTCKTLCDPTANPTTCEGALPCKPLGASGYGACDS
jgi:hypothetical protein